MEEKRFPSFLDKHPNIRWAWFVALLVFPILLWVLPADFFDNGTIVLCPSKLILGIDCYGCGITRATMHAHHFEWEDALYYNPLVVIIYPLLIIIWCSWVYKNAKELGFVKRFGLGE